MSPAHAIPGLLNANRLRVSGGVPTGRAGFFSGRSRGYCTWERRALAGRRRVFRVILRFSRIVDVTVMLSHVQRGPVCTWEDFSAVERWGVSA